MLTRAFAKSSIHCAPPGLRRLFEMNSAINIEPPRGGPYGVSGCLPNRQRMDRRIVSSGLFAEAPKRCG
jgi:hypothetical protein